MPLSKEQREAMIGFVTANCGCWNLPGDKVILNSLSDDGLQKLHDDTKKRKDLDGVVLAFNSGFVIGDKKVTLDQNTLKFIVTNVDAVPPPKKGEEEDDEEEDSETEEATAAKKTNKKTNKKTSNKVTNKANKPMTSEEWMSTAPPEIQEFLASAKLAVNNERTQILTALTTNMKTDLEKQTFISKFATTPVETLRLMLSIAPPTTNSLGDPIPAYLGANGYPGVNNGQPITNSAVSQQEVLQPVTLDFSK